MCGSMGLLSITVSSAAIRGLTPDKKRRQKEWRSDAGEAHEANDLRGVPDGAHVYGTCAGAIAGHHR